MLSKNSLPSAMTEKTGLRFWYNPKVRSALFQLLFIGLLFLLVASIVNNTTANLEQRGITTGFDFLNQEAGFGILQSLIEYDETHSFGRTFVVGLLNTALISVLGIILSTVVGFVIGVGRLSGNWLIARLCTVYIEIFRNIPVLLQILFWYIAVLRTLPSPRQSIALGDSVFLNLRGLYLPAPQFHEGAELILTALALAIVVIAGFMRWSHKRQEATGQTLPNVSKLRWGLLLLSL